MCRKIQLCKGLEACIEGVHHVTREWRENWEGRPRDETGMTDGDTDYTVIIAGEAAKGEDGGGGDDKESADGEGETEEKESAKLDKVLEMEVGYG